MGEYRNPGAERGVVQYGLLFAHASHLVYIDLVGPAYPSRTPAAAAGVAAHRAGGFCFTVMWRAGPGGRWRECGSGRTARETLTHRWPR